MNFSDVFEDFGSSLFLINNITALLLTQSGWQETKHKA